MKKLPPPLKNWLQALSKESSLPRNAAETLTAAFYDATSGIQTSGDVSETRIGRFSVMELLGEGGTGSVYKVYDPKLMRFIALKIIHQRRLVDDSSLQRFIAEARLTALLQHPSVLPIHEIGRLEDGRVYFTMQQVKGRTLTEALQDMHAGKAGAPSRRDLITVLQRVAEAISYAHSQDIIHRDLKPDNVMLGDFGEIYILDWGVARLIEDANPEQRPTTADPLRPQSRRLTGFGQAIGTPDYMAPEQAAGSNIPIGPAADIYSLGSILFEILIGRPPVFGLADVAQHRTASPSGEGIPPGLEDFLQRILSPDPRTRYTDARGMLKALRQWLEDQSSWTQSRDLLREATEMFEDAQALEQTARTRRQEADRQLSLLTPWAPDNMRAQAWDLLSESRSFDQRAAALYAERVHLLRLALYAAPNHEAVRNALANHYRERHAFAEQNAHQSALSRTELMLRRFDRGRYRSYLSGEGMVNLRADPPKAMARLLKWRLLQQRLYLEDTSERLHLPLDEYRLPMGSYILQLSAPERQTIRYPICLRREDSWDTTPPGEERPVPVILPKHLDTERERAVPAGWFWAGGDPNATGGNPSLRRYWVDSFAMQRGPVTNQDYLVFLQALWTADQHTELKRFAPLSELLHIQVTVDGPALVSTSYAALPVVGVTLHAAHAYASWLAEKENLPWRLPEEWEWEKAARGVDHRRYPWGDHFEVGRCNMRLSQPSGAALVPVGSCPVDSSPYEILDMAGNVSEWCETRFRSPPESDSRIHITMNLDLPEVDRVIRGGAWKSIPQQCLVASRLPAWPDAHADHIGFRLVRSLG